MVNGVKGPGHSGHRHVRGRRGGINGNWEGGGRRRRCSGSGDAHHVQAVIALTVGADKEAEGGIGVVVVDALRRINARIRGQVHQRREEGDRRGSAAEAGRLVQHEPGGGVELVAAAAKLIHADIQGVRVEPQRRIVGEARVRAARHGVGDRQVGPRGGVGDRRGVAERNHDAVREAGGEVGDPPALCLAIETHAGIAGLGAAADGGREERVR